MATGPGIGIVASLLAGEGSSRPEARLTSATAKRLTVRMSITRQELIDLVNSAAPVIAGLFEFRTPPAKRLLSVARLSGPPSD